MNDFDGDGVDEDRVTLENLLRLKRHERPPDDFWEDFDVVLKKRTLQSVVRKKSWFGMTALRSHVHTPWGVGLSVGFAVLAVALCFAPLTEFMSPAGQEVASPLVLEAVDASPVVTAGIEGSQIREYKDGALTLSNSLPTEFDTAFPSNDLRVVISDSITYAEENLSALFAESELSDSRTTF